MWLIGYYKHKKTAFPLFLPNTGIYTYVQAWTKSLPHTHTHTHTHKLRIDLEVSVKSTMKRSNMKYFIISKVPMKYYYKYHCCIKIMISTTFCTLNKFQVSA